MRLDDLHPLRFRHHALEPDGQTIELRVLRHALLQRPRLADIEHFAIRAEHAVDAGRRRRGFRRFSDDGDAACGVDRD